MTLADLAAEALRAYLADIKKVSEITRKLNEVYSRLPARLHPVLAEIQARTMGVEERQSGEANSG